MSNQAELFDFVEAKKARDRGKSLAAQKRRRLLTKAREVAREIAQQHGVVTADDVQARLIALGYHPSELGNAAGSIFRTGFKWTGKITQSYRVSNHARMIKVWQLT